MTRSRLVMASLGSAVVLAMTVGAQALWPAAIAPTVHAQPQMESESQRLFVLAIANAIASVAVDSERTALAVNDAADQIKTLQARIDKLEKRLAVLEKR